jgi:hypothetical protein
MYLNVFGRATVARCLTFIPFLPWDLSMQPMTHICFFNPFICIGACACSPNLNYAYKCIENSVIVQKCHNEPWKIPKFNTTLLLFYVDTKKKLKARRGNEYRFVHKGDTFPTGTMRLVVRSLYPNLPQMGQFFHHNMLMPFHDSMPSFMNFRQVLDLLEF